MNNTLIFHLGCLYNSNFEWLMVQVSCSSILVLPDLLTSVSETLNVQLAKLTALLKILKNEILFLKRHQKSVWKNWLPQRFRLIIMYWFNMLLALRNLFKNDQAVFEVGIQSTVLLLFKSKTFEVARWQR